MNKARRHELKMLKYKRRLKIYNIKEGETENENYHAYRSHGCPCSCYMCRGEKYREIDRQRNKKIDLD